MINKQFESCNVKPQLIGKQVEQKLVQVAKEMWLNYKCGNGSDSMRKEQSLKGMCKDLKINAIDLLCTNDTLDKITRHNQMQFFLNGGIKIKMVVFRDFQSLIKEKEIIIIINFVSSI